MDRTAWQAELDVAAALNTFSLGITGLGPGVRCFSVAFWDMVSPKKLETRLRTNSAGIPYALRLRTEAVGFPTFGLLQNTVASSILGWGCAVVSFAACFFQELVRTSGCKSTG